MSEEAIVGAVTITPPVAPVAAPVPPAAPAVMVAPPAHPAAVQPPPAEKPVTLSFLEVQELLADRARLVGIEEARVKAEAAAEEAKAFHLAKQGEWEKGYTKLKADKDAEIQANKNEAAMLRARTEKFVLDGELGTALADYSLVEGGHELLKKQWRDQFTVKPDGDRFTVQNPNTFQTVKQFVAEQLSKPPYTSLVRAALPNGGTGAIPGTPAAPVTMTPPEPPAVPVPRNMGEAVILHMQGLKKTSGDPQTNMSVGMGLKAIR